MSVDPFLKKKWERVFYTFFDVNRNKVIDWNDFEMLFEKIKDIRGADSNEYRIVSDAMRTVWRGLLHITKGLDLFANIDINQQISIEEWDKLWQKFDPKHMDIWQWEYLKYMFFLIDTSGDKKIDVKEYKEVMKIYGMSDADCQKAFDKFAVDENGKKTDSVDYGQFVKLWNDYFCSPDKNKPGSSLFGPW